MSLKFARTSSTGWLRGSTVTEVEPQVDGATGVWSPGTFDGTSCDAYEELSPSAGELTLFVRVRPDKPGGLLHTSALALLIHDNGLAMAFVGQQDGERQFYRDVLLGPVTLGERHDLVLRARAGTLEFFCDGVLSNRVPLAHRLCPVLPNQTIVGGWRVDDPPLPDFPQWIIEFVFQRLFSGRIEQAAAWDRALSDDDVARLSGVNAIDSTSRDTDWHRCLDAYTEFALSSESLDVDTCSELGARMRRQMALDPQRPTYHLTAPMGWISDPAGALFHDGQYHLFSYRNILGCLAFTALDHYVTDELVHWRDMPVAAWADSDADVHGIWLANHVIDDGIPTTLYTAHGRRGKVGVLARSTNGLLSFGDKRIVITDPIHHDGETWRSGDMWYTTTTQQCWGGHPEGGDAILLLRSDDLRDWSLVGEVFRVPPYNSPADDLQRWAFTEFPYLAPFGDKYALMLGTRPSTYWVGNFDERTGRFTPDESEPKLLDYFNPVHCFNPSTVDDRGPGGAPRRIIYAMHANAAGHVDGLPWKGFHVLPRVLTRQGTRLLQEPIPELQQLRRQRLTLGPLTIGASTSGHLPEQTGDTLEIIARFEAASAQRFGLCVRVSADTQQGTRIFYDVGTDQFGAEGGLAASPYPEQGSGPAYQDPTDPVEFRVFLDKACFEVFVNGHTGSGVFDADPASTGMDLFSEGGTARLLSLDIWQIAPAWG